MSLLCLVSPLSFRLFLSRSNSPRIYVFFFTSTCASILSFLDSYHMPGDPQRVFLRASPRHILMVRAFLSPNKDNPTLLPVSVVIFFPFETFMLSSLPPCYTCERNASQSLCLLSAPNFFWCVGTYDVHYYLSWKLRTSVVPSCSTLRPFPLDVSLSTLL